MSYRRDRAVRIWRRWARLCKPEKDDVWVWTVPSVAADLTEWNDARAAAIENAPDDVMWLLGEVKRLQRRSRASD